jgi:hypothetical protein
LEPLQGAAGAGFRRPVRARFGELLLVALIVMCATALSAYWAFRVPMFLEPDEIAHADAAFAYFDAGKPFRLKRAVVGNFVTPEAQYLSRVTGYRRLRYNAYASATQGYGTAAYFRRIDTNAPEPAGVFPANGATIPYVLAYYPSPYYGLVALAMRAGWNAFGRSLTAAFFCGRLLNVALLSFTLVLAYATLCCVTRVRAQRLLLLGGIAFFPLTTWMGASIQPDNQSALFVSASLLAALRLRRHPKSLVALLALAIGESALGVTKLQYALVAIAALGVVIRGVLVRQSPERRALTLTVAYLVPLLVAFGGRYLSPVGRLGLPHDATQLEQLGIAHRAEANAYQLFSQAVTDATLGGRAIRGFWFHFSIRNDSIFTGTAADVATAVLVFLTVLGIAVWAARQIHLVRHLLRISKRYGFAPSLRFIGTDPFLNLYAGVSIVLFGVYAFTGGYLTLQGRYWYPVLLPIVILSARTAGASVPRRFARRAATIACAFWALYAAVAAPLAVVAMERGFYHNSNIVPSAEIGSIESIAVDGTAVPNVGDIRVPRGASLAIAGSALDSSLGLPARDVGYRIDEGPERRAATGLTDRLLPATYNDPALIDGGFAFRFSTTGLRPGAHQVLVFARERRSPEGLPLASLSFTVIARSASRTP